MISANTLIIVLVVITLIILGVILFQKPKEGFIPKIEHQGIKLGCYQDGCFPGQTEFVGRCWLNQDLNKIPLMKLIDMEKQFREGKLFPQNC
jgi:hypothetical protein